MKNLLITLILSISFTSAYSQFRNTTWGMSREEVKQIEKAEATPSERNSNKLTYSIITAQFKCVLIYDFEDNKLKSIEYVFSNLDYDREATHERSELWLTTVANLESKYGKPYSNNKGSAIWQNDNYTIRAYTYDPYTSKKVKVEYTPPLVNQKDIL